MHSGWLLGFGIGTGMLLSGLALSSHPVASGSALMPDTGLEPASAATQRPAAARPAGRIGAVPVIVTAPSNLPLLEEDDEDHDARDARRRALDEKFRSASREARDEAWARVMESSVQAALDQVVTAAPVAVGKPDCRTRHCQFDVEWADRDTALTAASEVLAMLPGECARTITHIDDEQDEYDAYKSRVLLDCPRAAEPQR
jgi:hypothetical protein